MQREISPSLVATIGYVGSQDHALMDAYEVNGAMLHCVSVSISHRPLHPVLRLAGPSARIRSTRPLRGKRLTVQGPLSAPILVAIWPFATVGNSNYSSLQSSLKYATKYVNFLAAYTWSKSIDDSSGGTIEGSEPL